MMEGFCGADGNAITAI